MAPSSNRLGHRSFTPATQGSNPAGVTNICSRRCRTSTPARPDARAAREGGLKTRCVACKGSNPFPTSMFSEAARGAKRSKDSLAPVCFGLYPGPAQQPRSGHVSALLVPAWVLRHWEGDMPNAPWNLRLKQDRVLYPTASAISAILPLLPSSMAAA